MAALPHVMELIARARGLKLAVFDVDGVLTDGSLYLLDSADELKAFNSLDGHGMKMLHACGVESAIITGRRSKLVEVRSKNLGVRHLYQGVENKGAVFRELLAQLAVDPAHTSYMGDDLVDLDVMRACGFAVTVNGAPPALREIAHLVTRAPAGAGAVREYCNFVLRAKGSWQRLGAQR